MSEGTILGENWKSKSELEKRATIQPVLFHTMGLWPVFMWYTGMCSPNGDQSGQWRSIRMASQWPLIMTSQWVITLLGMPIVKSKWVMMLLGISTVMSLWNNYILMCTRQGITMHNKFSLNKLMLDQSELYKTYILFILSYFTHPLDSWSMPT